MDGTAVVAPNGTVLLPLTSGCLGAFNACTGALLWNSSIPQAAAAAGPRGRVPVAGGGLGRTLPPALTPTVTPPALSLDGGAVVGTSDG